MNTSQFHKRTNMFLTSSLRPESRTSIAINKNSFDTWGNKRSSFSTLLMKIFTIITLGLFLFTSCKKDELTPSINESNLKAGGTTYYISPTGNDTTGNGNIGTPWRSLYKASSTLSTSGSIIHVNAGTYLETHQCIISEGVSIEGMGVTSHIIFSYVGGDETNSAILLETYPSGGTAAQSISNLKLDGNLTSNSAITVFGRSNIKIHDLTIIDFTSQGIYMRGGATLGTQYATGNEIYNNIITNCTSRELVNGSGLINLSGQDGTLIHDNILTQNSRPQGYNGNIICSVIGYNKGVKYYNNKSYKPINEGVVQPYLTNTASGWNFHWESWTTRGGMEVYNNEFHNGVALDVAGVDNLKGDYDYSWWIHDNLFIQDTYTAAPASGVHYSGGVDFEATNEDCIVENNHFKNMPTGVAFDIGQSSRHQRNIIVRENLFESMGYSDIGWSFVILIGSMSDVTNAIFDHLYFYNNTILGNGLRGAFYLESGGVSGSTINNIYIRNNIIQGVVGNYGWLAIWDGTGTINSIYVDHNDIYNNVNSNAVYYRNGKTVTNYVSNNNIGINPLFVSSTDFHLQAGSPCLNAGIDVGLPYNGSLPDIGTFETSAGGGSTGSANQSPIIQNQSFQLVENSSNGITVGSIVASDPDAGQTKTFSIISGNISGAFAMNASTGALTVANSTALNLTTNPTFLLIIQVQDNGTPSLNRQATITINLKSAGTTTNAPPVINNQSFSLSKSAPKGTEVGTVVASDPNAGQMLTYSIIAGNTNSGFAINSSTGKITVRNQYAYKYHSQQKLFQLSVKVVDNGAPALSNQAAISINIK